MLPNPPVQINFTISPGDEITASLKCTLSYSSSTQSWTLTMTDVTSGAPPWSETFAYNSSRLSAEWIEEAPASSGGVLPLADYGTATFDLGTANGSSPNLSSSNGIVMEDAQGQSSNVSPPDSETTGGADRFSTCWGNGTLTFTQCSAPVS